MVWCIVYWWFWDLRCVKLCEFVKKWRYYIFHWNMGCMFLSKNVEPTEYLIFVNPSSKTISNALGLFALSTFGGNTTFMDSTGKISGSQKICGQWKLLDSWKRIAKPIVSLPLGIVSLRDFTTSQPRGTQNLEFTGIYKLSYNFTKLH